MSAATINDAMSRIEVAESPLAVFRDPVLKKERKFDVIPVNTIMGRDRMNRNYDLLVGVFDRYDDAFSVRTKLAASI